MKHSEQQVFPNEEKRRTNTSGVPPPKTIYAYL